MPRTPRARPFGGRARPARRTVADGAHSAPAVRARPPVTGRVRATRRQDKRERILAAAIRAFAAAGFHATRVSDVARIAGVADGTIYLYFHSKNDLLAAVFASAMERFSARGEARLWEDDDPVHQLQRLIELHLELLGEDRDLAVVFQIDLRHSLQFLSEVSRGTLRGYLELIAGIVARGQGAERFAPDLPPLEAAKLVFGVLDELATNWVLSDRNYRLASKAPEAAAFLLRALGEGGAAGAPGARPTGPASTTSTSTGAPASGPGSGRGNES
jgi:TetR/AcrR family fatty acid metabolism transcriptional regulator